MLTMYKKIICCFLTIFIVGSFVLSEAILAADFSDPEWPCIQRKVETISVGQIWPNPIEEETISGLGTEINFLATNLTLRRLTTDEATELVKTFLADQPNIDRKQLLEQVFLKFFENINQRRREVIAGIGRYALKQTALSEKIDSNRKIFGELLDADSPDFDKIDEVEETLDWDQRIYDERARSLIYVCEIPVLIEKHAYSIAQILQKEIQ